MFTRYASSSLAPNENRYDFARDYQLYPERENRSAFARLRHDFSDRLTVFAQFVYSDNVTDYTWTPAVANSSSVLTSAGTTLKIAAANPYNPFNTDLTSFNYREPADRRTGQARERLDMGIGGRLRPQHGEGGFAKPDQGRRPASGA